MKKIEKLKKQLAEIKAKKQAILEEIKYWQEMDEYLYKKLGWIQVEEKRLKTLINELKKLEKC